ncbi:MAG: hypothetical protein ACK5U7_15165 [Bacteroidota bacterium]|jgi:hypothetical protein
MESLDRAVNTKGRLFLMYHRKAKRFSIGVWVFLPPHLRGQGIDHSGGEFGPGLFRELTSFDCHPFQEGSDFNFRAWIERMRGPSAHEQLERKLQSQEKEELDSLVRSEEFRKQQVRSLKQRNMYEAARAVEQQPGVYMDPNMLGSDQVRQINENWHSKGKVSVTKDVE